METIILISVLSTIGVVALVSSIVFAFIKLGKKVDDQDFITQSNNILEDIRKIDDQVNMRISNESKIIYDRNEEINTEFIEIYQALEKLESRLDSRSDKLHSLIKEVEKSIQKQVVL